MIHPKIKYENDACLNEFVINYTIYLYKPI